MTKKKKAAKPKKRKKRRKPKVSFESPDQRLTDAFQAVDNAMYHLGMIRVGDLAGSTVRPETVAEAMDALSKIEDELHRSTEGRERMPSQYAE